MSAISSCRRDDGCGHEDRIRTLEELAESSEQRTQELVRKLAESESSLGDIRAELVILEGAVDAHYEATFGHSACFERDEALWAHRTQKDGKNRTWVRESVPPEQEHRLACDLYRARLFKDKA